MEWISKSEDSIPEIAASIHEVLVNSGIRTVLLQGDLGAGENDIYKSPSSR